MASLLEEEDVAARFTRPFERGSFDELAPLTRERAADGTHTDIVARDEAYPRHRITSGMIVGVLAGGAVVAIALLALFGTTTSSAVASRRSEPVAARPPAASPAPAAVTRVRVAAAAPVPAPAHAVPARFIRVPVTSTPPGATVTVLDRNQPRMAGRTPVELALDPARTYDVIVAMPKHPTRLVHVTPSKVTHLAIDMRTPAGR